MRCGAPGATSQRGLVPTKWYELSTCKGVERRGIQIQTTQVWRANHPDRDEFIEFAEWPDVSFYVPTLSELIEACGEMFGSLVKSTHFGATMWLAHSRNARPAKTEGGSTPEEAVARLWLALNKKV
jgi:hypothetical protein